MKEIIRYGFILMFICAAAAGLLAGVNSLTRGKILAQAQAQEDTSLKELIPEAATFVAVNSGEETLYYRALDKDNKLLGVVFKAKGQGYAGEIETMAGMLPDGTVSAIKVIRQDETPGLGARVAEADFSGQFKGQNALELQEVEAITGATISSSAVINSVQEKAKQIMAIIKNG